MDILIIEDNADISAALSKFLQNDGYSVHAVGSGEEGLRYISENEVRIVLLDIALPGTDGFAVCAKIRDGKNIPAIILSARTQKDDKLNGFLLGADDYIEKPFDIDLLKAKINSLYRRHYSKEKAIDLGWLKIDCESRTVKYMDNFLELGAKEFDLLDFLVKNRGKALRKEFIFNSVWGIESFSEPSTLTVHISRLRDKIEKDPKNPRRILTVWGVGYKFEE
jgi:DNA-binding response OmpR family regulator